jgi:signal transduction histidine kinase/CheY-like chemotaxis protein
VDPSILSAPGLDLVIEDNVIDRRRPPMPQTLTWWPRSPDPELAALLDELRADALRFFLGVTAAGFLTWHYIGLIAHTAADNSLDVTVRRWALFGVVGAGLLAAWLLRRRVRPASAVFLASGLLALTAAVWLLDAPQLLLGYPMVALAATVLWHPLAGLLTSAASLGLLVALRAGPLPTLADDQVLAAAVASALTVAVAWALGQMLVTAATWSARGHAEAMRHAREARANRAELVQALKQLDHAYYRLGRANAALELAWKAAEEAERSKTEFVTNISHELRTPLNLVIGFSELILTSPESYPESLPAPYRGDLQAIYRSAQHLLTLTNDVIDLARVGMGRLALLREPVDLAEVIGDACAIVREYVAAKHLALRIELPPGLPVLPLDHLRIRQVLLNLLTNAVRYTERGGITIAATLGEADVLVEVRDTGRGMSPEALRRAFEEFEHGQGESARLPGGFGGVGLGLPLSRRLVELHGGQMGASSAVGAGSTFWFTLPVTGDAADRGPVGRSRRPSAPTRSAERVLILAYPDAQLHEFLHRRLAGWRILPAPDLAEAGRLAIEEHALAILTDDDSDGAAGAEPPVPVVRLPLPRGERLATALGATAFLVKPLTRVQLRATLARLPHPPRIVLVVDDDPRFVRLLTRMLEATPPASPAVLVAYNGREALDLMAARTPDLVLLDLVMPERTGAEVLTAMRADPRLAVVPVVLISAQDQLAAQSPLRGAVTLTRPDGFRLEEVLGALEALLGALSPPRPLPSPPAP